MSIYEQIQWLANSEEANEAVFNRPLKKLVDLLDKGEIDISVNKLLEFNKSLADDTAPTDNITLIVNRGSETNAIIRWNEETNKWEFSNGDGTFHEFGSEINIYDFDASEGQTEFEVNYSLGKLEVFYEGIKLRDNQYTADNGTSVVLNDSASDGDWINIKTW